MRAPTHLAVLSSFLSLATCHLAGAAIRSVPSSYPTIQAAIAASNPGDTVRVSPKPGGAPYAENVVVNKANLTLQGLFNPTLDGTTLSFSVPGFPDTLFGNDAVTIVASGVSVSGFTIQNYNYPTNNGLFTPAAGVHVSQQVASDIRNNTLRNNGTGVFVEGLFSFEVVQTYAIEYNTISGNHNYGAWLRGVDGTATINANTVTGNGETGIVLDAVNGARVKYNTVSGNGSGFVEFLGPTAAGILVSGGGTISGNPNARLSKINNNSVGGNAGAGIYVSNSDSQQILSNGVLGNSLGIGLESCFGVVVSSNLVAQNQHEGILLQLFTSQCTLQQNIVTGNQGCGISVAQFFMEFFGFPDCVGNSLSRNLSMANSVLDAEDTSGSTAATVQNAWFLNIVGTSNPAGLGP